MNLRIHLCCSKHYVCSDSPSKNKKNKKSRVIDLVDFIDFLSSALMATQAYHVTIQTALVIKRLNTG